MSSVLTGLQYNKVLRNLYSQVAVKTVNSTAAETSLLDATGCLGSLTIPANFMNVGTILYYKCKGTIRTNTATTPTGTMKLKFGSTELVASTVTIPTITTPVYIDADVSILCTAIGVSGSVILMGRTMVGGGATLSAASFRQLIGSSVTVDTTATQLFGHTYQWSASHANNSVIIYQAVLDSVCLKGETCQT